MESRKDTTNDNEALVPKRKKRKKKEPPIQALLKEITFSPTLLAKFDNMLSDEETSIILDKNYYNNILKFFNAKDMLFYSLTSRRAYVNTHTNVQHRLTLYAEPTEKKLKQVTQMFTDIEAATNTNISLVKEICSGRTMSSFILVMLLVVALIAPGLALYGHGKGISFNATRHNDTQMEAKANDEMTAGWILFAALPTIGLALWIMLARHLKKQLNLRLENNNQDIKFFENTPKTIEKPEDLLHTQNTLMLFSQRNQKTENADTEKTALLKKNQTTLF